MQEIQPTFTAGANALTRTFQGMIKGISNAPPVLDFGKINDDYSLTTVEGKVADAFQFRARYRVSTTSGINSAKLKKILLQYIGTLSGEVDSNTIVSGDTAELYFVVKNFGSELSTAIISVRLKPLADSQLHAFAKETHAD